MDPGCQPDDGLVPHQRKQLDRPGRRHQRRVERGRRRLAGRRLHHGTHGQVLGDLGALPGANNPRKTLTSSALGRNVALFDLTRAWAYRTIRTHWDGPQGTWDADVLAYAWQHNETVIANDFTRGPLAFTEVQHLAQSIARWTWRNMTRETFHARQAALSKQATKAASEARHKQAEALRQEQRQALI